MAVTRSGWQERTQLLQTPPSSSLTSIKHIHITTSGGHAEVLSWASGTMFRNPLSGWSSCTHFFIVFNKDELSLGVGKSSGVTILTLEQNPPERKFLTYIKIFSQEDFALKSKLWPPSFLQHLPIFAGNSHFTGISQLRAGKTRSKRPCSHWLSTRHFLPYMWASFYP